MASKAMFSKPSSLLAMSQRGIYAKGTEPFVFINEHTKVICQGMTGKHVSIRKTPLTIHAGNFPH
jgi:hypothetical protein